MMRLPPGVPRIMKGLPSRVTIVGLIELNGRLPGAIAFACPCTSPYTFGTLRVTGLRRAEAEVLLRIALEDVEDLAHDRASGAGRRRGHDVIAAIVALDRREFARVVLLEILLGDDALARLARGGDRTRDRTLVEAIAAFLRDRPQRFREVLLHEPGSRRERLALVLEDGR